MEDFEKKICADVIVEMVNLTRATWKEAGELKKILDEDVLLKYRRIVVDISKCEFMDSTFLGALVVAQKKITQLGGEIKLVEPLDGNARIVGKSLYIKVIRFIYNSKRSNRKFQLQHGTQKSSSVKGSKDFINPNSFPVPEGGLEPPLACAN